jgi:3-methyladenine DNA glycosylase AlkC
MAPFFYLPHVLFVAERGLDHFDLSMHAQYELTKRFSAESSIRPYIARDPERVLAMLRTWTKDRNAHVRRLVSEGTRLRLPWAPRVPWLDANPERVLSLLEALKDDASTMVRRSVANNLNDLGKVRPDLLIRTARAWLNDGSAARRSLIEHALRSAVKRGEREALRLLGYGKKPSVSLERVTFTPRSVRIGERVAMSFTLRSTSRAQQDLLVDVAVHFVKARRVTAAKVFKVARLVLAPRATVSLKAAFSLAVHTTRVPQPGRHAVDVIVNGHAMRAGHSMSSRPGNNRRGRPFKDRIPIDWREQESYGTVHRAGHLNAARPLVGRVEGCGSDRPRSHVPLHGRLPLLAVETRLRRDDSAAAHWCAVGDLSDGASRDRWRDRPADAEAPKARRVGPHRAARGALSGKRLRRRHRSHVRWGSSDISVASSSPPAVLDRSGLEKHRGTSDP